MTENEEVLKLAAKIYTFYFTKDGGYLELDPYDPKLIHMRSQCYKHAIAFCNTGEENANIERKITKDQIV